MTKQGKYETVYCKRGYSHNYGRQIDELITWFSERLGRYEPFALTEDERTIDDITKKLKDVSKAEAVVLTTKNKLYDNWKKTFRDVVIGRYESL